MKARTPSFMARFRFFLAVAICLHIAACRAAAEDGSLPVTNNVTEAAPTVSEPDDKAPHAESQKVQPAPTSRATYQNPFAEESKAPPIEGAVQSASANQWRRPTIPRWVAPPSEPEGENKLPKLVAPTQPVISSSAAASAKKAAERTSETATPTPAKPTAKALIQPELVGGGPAHSHSKAAGPIRSPFAAEVQKKNVVSANNLGGPADSPESSLARAQEIASHAASIDELSQVIELCDRGLLPKPSGRTLLSLQRLAAWAHNRRGEISADAQRLEDALRDFQAAIELDPQCSLAIHNRGVTFAQRNQFAAALRDFDRVIELNPGLAVAYRNRAELLSALDRTQDALADYDRAITSLPNDAALYLARASAKQRLGNFAGAAADIEHALKLNPNDAATFVQRGNLAADQGRFADAENDFRRAIAVDSKLADAHRSLAWLQATCPDGRFRKPEQALASAKRAAELLPENYEALDTLAAAEASAGNFAGATELQQKAIALAPLNLNNPLQERLVQYQQHHVYRTPGPTQNVRTASMESPATPDATQPAVPSAKPSGIVR